MATEACHSNLERITDSLLNSAHTKAEVPSCSQSMALHSGNARTGPFPPDAGPPQWAAFLPELPITPPGLSALPCGLRFLLPPLPPFSLLLQVSSLHGSQKALLTHLPTSLLLLHYPIQVFSQCIFPASNPSWHLPLRGPKVA